MKLQFMKCAKANTPEKLLFNETGMYGYSALESPRCLEKNISIDRIELCYVNV